jgi:ribosomal protein S18 acetylase RimI-like enzyme
MRPVNAALVGLRRAGPADAARLLPMMADFNRGEQIEVPAAVLAPALERLLGGDDLGRVWLIEAGGATAGYAVLTFGYDLEFAGRDAFLTELYLRPEARGRGLGRQALSAIEEAAAVLAVHAIHLMVRPENQAAVALYAAAGYLSPPRTMLSKTL